MKATQDLHVHTHLSLCATPEARVQPYIDQAASYGLTTLGFTDHLWDDAIGQSVPGSTYHDFYSPQNMNHILKLRDEIEHADKRGVRILFGAEADYDPVRKDVSISEEAAASLDLLLVPNSHTHLVMPRELYEPHEKHAMYMLEATKNVLKGSVARYITALAHPFDAVCCPYDKALLYRLIPESAYEDVFFEAKEKNIAIEINTSYFTKTPVDEIKNDPKWEFMAIAKRCGCKFTFGSDSHHPDSQSSILASEEISRILGLTEKDILLL